MPKHNNGIDLVLKNYNQQIKKRWKLASLVVFLTNVGDVLVFYVPPLVVAALIKNLDENRFTPEALLPYVALMALLWGLGELCWRLAFHLLIKFQVTAITALYKDALRWILEKDLGFFNNNFTGSLTKRILAYGQRFENFTDTIAFNITNKIVPLIFISFVLWQFSPWLVVTLFVMIGMLIAIATPRIRHRSQLVKTREEASNTLSGHVADVVTNINAVKSFAHEQEELSTHNKYVGDLMKKTAATWNYHNLHIDTAISPFYVLINAFGLVIAIMLGRGNAVDIGAIFVTFSYFTTFSRTFWDFNGIYRQLESSITEAAQYAEMLYEKPKISDHRNAQKLMIKDGEITFNEVGFAHEDDDQDVLFENFNLHIKPGEKIGLVGQSGSGKTTLTKLLLRFMDIDSGAISIDGQNIAEVTQESLRKAIGYVPQEPALFHRSLKNNIAYGNPSATNEAIKNAASLAHASEFIDKLPHTYDTLVGERGVKLSGGQRQRIAIARAMLKNAPILILDEATSALDSESEVLIQDALWKLMEGKTAIVIAHRLSTIQKMDRIIVLDNGNIVEQGTHTDLLKKNGTYAKLWSHQSGGFIEE